MCSVGQIATGTGKWPEMRFPGRRGLAEYGTDTWVLTEREGGEWNGSGTVSEMDPMYRVMGPMQLCLICQTTVLRRGCSPQDPWRM